MGILSLIYMMRTSKFSTLMLISTAQSFTMLGIKISRVTALQALWSEQAKQKVKITHRGILNDSAEDLLLWLKAIPALTAYVSVIKENGITGAQMLKIDSDQPLTDLGIESNVDRSEAIHWYYYQ